LTGIDAYTHPQKARLETLKLLDVDVEIPPLTDSPPDITFEKGEGSQVDQRGKRVVRWGAGRTWNWDHGSLFQGIDDVLRFDPESFLLAEEQQVLFDDLVPIQKWFGFPLKGMAEKFQEYQATLQNMVGDTALVPGFYYRTLIMWPLMLFGWELFSELAYVYPHEFQRLWKQFAGISEKVVRAYSMTDIECMWSHDDICMTTGPIFNPQWYRKNLYPYYERIWEPLRAKGIKILFISDGNLDKVIDDVLAAGADGFLAEPTTDLAHFVRKYKDTAIFVGNIDARILLFGDRADIRKEVERCTSFGKDAPGYFYSVSNHLAWNIPPENVGYYFDCCRELGQR